MAKRKSTSVVQDNTPDLLAKPKKQFAANLTVRIQIGLELKERNVTDMSELGKLESDYSSWHDFNCELLKRAFNKNDNQYYNEYIYDPPHIYIGSMYPSAPYFGELAGKVRGAII